MRHLSLIRSLVAAASAAASVWFGPGLAASYAADAGASTNATEMAIPNASIPMRVLVQSPADTDTELQIICLFHSDPANTLHGALIETNDKLKGLLDQIRKPALFRGDLGETLLIAPPVGSLGAKKLLIIGLGDSKTFKPQRMELIGSIVFREANRLGSAHPIFAPTVLDGGVTRYTTGEVSEQVIMGFLRGAHAEEILKKAAASQGQVIEDLTYLAGAKFAPTTKEGIEKAIAADGGK